MSPTASFSPRQILTFALLIPVAILMGYALAVPLDYATAAAIGGMVVLLLSPLLINHHHLALVFSIHAAVIVFFLPGDPRLWMLMTALSLGFAILGRLLDKERQFLIVPKLMWPLLILAGIIVLTAMARGGIGLRSFGSSSQGGKRYVELLLGIATFFALTAQRIPPEKARLYTTLFLLSSMTAAMSNIVYKLGPNLWWLYLIFPVEFALSQAEMDFSVVANHAVARTSGISFAAIGPFMYLVARYGVAGLLDFRRPWRFAAMLVCVGVGMAGGFRSVLIFMGLLFVIQFWLEGLFRTRLFLILIIAGVIGSAVLLPFANKLPLSVQRTLSFLPLDLNPIARLDAKISTDWRLEMWQVLMPDLPKYLLLGKGYAINPTDLYLVYQAQLRGLTKDYEMALLAGDYHNGPLSIYVPLGLPGTLAFIVFLFMSWRVLRANYRYGRADYRWINTFLLSYFISKVIFFIFVFGAISNDLILFVGTCGMSVCLNGGICKPGSHSTALEKEVPAKAAPASA